MPRSWVLLPLVALLLAVSPPLASAAVPTSAGARTEPSVTPDLLLAGGLQAAQESCSLHDLCPSAVRTAYDLTALDASSSTNGTGQSLVIVDACGDRTLRTDLAAFDLANGLPAANLTITKYGSAPLCNKAEWSLETSLDVEWAHVIAPGASLQLVVSDGPNVTDMFGAWNYVLTHALGSVISNSWSGGGGCSRTVRSLLDNASVAGVTVVASSGDIGAWGSGTSQRAQYPADCASVLTVGGTRLLLHHNGSYASEAAWPSSGGGFVPSIGEPAFQTRAGLTNAYGELGKPDVAAVADPSTGVWVYNHRFGGWNVVGGTSVACPIWAAFLVDVDDQRASLGFPTLGEVDPYLYHHVYGVNGSRPTYATELHDVTTGSNGWPAGVGWDAATGLGSPDGAPLLAQLGTHRNA